MIRWALVVGALLLASACQSQDAECHRRARELLPCCPFCDEGCSIARDPDAQLALESCMNVRADPSQHEGEGEGEDPAKPEDDPDFGEPTSGVSGE